MRGLARQDCHRAARQDQDQLPGLNDAVLVARRAAVPAPHAALGGRGGAVAREQRHHGAHRALRRHTVHGARAVQEGAAGGHARESQTAPVPAPGGGLHGRRHLPERHVPAGHGARQDGGHQRSRVRHAAGGLPQGGPRRGPRHSLQGVPRHRARSHPVRRCLLLHVRLTQTQISRVLRHEPGRAHQRGVRRVRGRAGADHLLPAGHRAPAHADRAPPPGRHLPLPDHPGHAQTSVQHGRRPRLLQRAQHELGEGTHRCRHLLRYLRRDPVCAAGPGALAAELAPEHPATTASTALTSSARRRPLLDIGLPHRSPKGPVGSGLHPAFPAVSFRSSVHLVGGHSPPD